MHDFSQKYRGVVHFGLWAEEGADLHGQHDAWAILARAVKNTVNEDVSCQELDDALAFLGRYAVRDRPFRDFRSALRICDPIERYVALKSAIERIGKSLPC